MKVGDRVHARVLGHLQHEQGQCGGIPMGVGCHLGELFDVHHEGVGDHFTHEEARARVHHQSALL
ncbi:hypothetical protein ACIQB5_45755 [Streptomyces sp. NPDC088560]|uniref:hypothetical protein n=1 Tax=Streptomyces sp. NPDC088560 TaxID=3365868 RepID=UPI00380F664D